MIGLLLIVTLWCESSAKNGLVGARVPDFSGTDLSSIVKTPFTLSSYVPGPDSQPVAICFSGSWCDLCIHELVFLDSLSASVYAGKLRIVIVCIDRKWGFKQQKFYAKARLAYPIVHDSSGLISLKFQRPPKLPFVVLVQPTGVVYTTVSGYSDRAKQFIRQSLERMASERKLFPIKR